MNKKALMLGSVLAALAFAPAAMAEPDSGWYGAFDLGYHWPDDADMTTSPPAASLQAPYEFNFELESDIAGFARLGYRLTPNWRLELEAGARAGDIEAVTGDTTRPAPNNLCSINNVLPACAPPEGSLQAYTLMGNLIWDVMPDSTLNPFVGFGVGIAKLDFQMSARSNAPLQAVGIDDQDTVFAYQWLAGLSWEATQRLNVDVTYRYLNTADGDWESTPTAAGFQPGVFSGDYVDHSLTFGLRYAFGETAAPPPPPPPPPPNKHKIRRKKQNYEISE